MKKSLFITFASLLLAGICSTHVQAVEPGKSNIVNYVELRTQTDSEAEAALIPNQLYLEYENGLLYLKAMYPTASELEVGLFTLYDWLIPEGFTKGRVYNEVWDTHIVYIRPKSDHIYEYHWNN